MSEAPNNRVTGFVMPVGNGAVGKTSLALTLERSTLPEGWQSVIAGLQKSQNLEFRYVTDVIEVMGTPYRVMHQYLVPPGQKSVEITNRERSFEDVLRIYQSIIRRVDVVLVSYKITDLDTYNDIEYWLEKINPIIHPKTIFILVGTHLDMDEQREVTDPIIKNGTAYASGLLKNLQPEWKGHVTSMEVSNTSGENIDRLRRLISGAILVACGVQVHG